MPSEVESRCCQEIQQVSDKAKDGSTTFKCITEHPGFAGGCLNVWALEIAYLQYRQVYGAVQRPLNE